MARRILKKSCACWCLTLAAWPLASCATQYRFISQPADAAVYFVNGGEKVLLGQTPIDFSKQALPTESPFVLVFEKPGYERKEVALAPSDNTLTTINVLLKPEPGLTIEENLKRVRLILSEVFSIQEKIVQHRYVDALSQLKTIESREPTLPEIYVLRGSIYLLLHDEDQALQAWSHALSLDPSMEALRARVARLKESRKDDGGARRAPSQ